MKDVVASDGLAVLGMYVKLFGFAMCTTTETTGADVFAVA